MVISSKRRVERWWKRPWCKLLSVVFFIGLITVLGSTLLRRPLQVVLEWVRGAGWHGGIIYVVIFWIGVILCVPSTAIEIGAGIVYPLPIAILTSLSGKLGGSCTAYLIAEHLGKMWLQNKIIPDSSKWIRGINRAVAQNPTKMAFLVRAAYIPIGVKNYGIALCEVPFSIFSLSVACVGLPYSVLWALIGNTIGVAAYAEGGNKQVRTIQLAVTATGSVILLVVLLLLGWYTKKAVDDILNAEAEADGGKAEGGPAADEEAIMTVGRPSLPSSTHPRASGDARLLEHAAAEATRVASEANSADGRSSLSSSSPPPPRMADAQPSAPAAANALPASRASAAGGRPSLSSSSPSPPNVVDAQRSVPSAENAVPTASEGGRSSLSSSSSSPLAVDARSSVLAAADAADAALATPPKVDALAAKVPSAGRIGVQSSVHSAASVAPLSVAPSESGETE
eukprot:TRINITY_DN10574_c0_g1_i1.p1 TRINITY_DN10574_c0_g1~~TRINITY_DN10574_c0_g1_i1.p1  ORF type:complete len:454 (-),score=79.05 TRINITY_DN10574_c0_g1_i1:216-1577(-)